MIDIGWGIESIFKKLSTYFQDTKGSLIGAFVISLTQTMAYFSHLSIINNVSLGPAYFIYEELPCIFAKA